MTAKPLFDLPEVECSGLPRELGRAQGEALRDRIAAFTAQRLAALRLYLSERGEARRESEFVAAGQACFEAARRFDPDGAAEHEGIAEAAGIDAALLYAATNMTDMRDVLLLPSDPAREGCTSLLVPKQRTRGGVVIAAQTWDLNPTDLDFVVAIHRKPANGPETWSVTCAGALSLMGMNAHGVAVGTTNIKTRASRIGVGYLTILHRMLGCRSRAEARTVALGAPRAAAHTYWVADAEGASEFESDPATVTEHRLEESAIVQTNHCQTAALRDREGEPAAESSLRRLARARALLESGEQDVTTIQALLADRADGVFSINRYTEDDQGTTTNGCVVCVPSSRELFACRGPADRGIWKQLRFDARAG